MRTKELIPAKGGATTQIPVVDTRGFAENTQPNDFKRVCSQARLPHTVFETERYSDRSDTLLNDNEKTTHKH